VIVEKRFISPFDYKCVRCNGVKQSSVKADLAMVEPAVIEAQQGRTTFIISLQPGYDMLACCVVL